ncbi:MAG: 6-phosphofructokinase, partial [Phascolarctobacterium sp.]|nr:6-phosphofructokinase [Phascolarctobacterium sp.]
MAEKKRRFAVLTGGGDCPGLNAVIRAVIKTFLQNGREVFGIYNGFNGLINGNLKLMNYADVSGILPRGGTILGTTNRDNPFKFAVEENGELVYYDMRDKVVENLQKHDIEALVVIGGDGSLNIGAKLARECGIKVVGVPKTIDNDLPCTERTFGFDTAVAMATEAVDRLHTTAESHHRVMALEVMGRYAGWIALHSGIAGGADVILIPEIPYDIDSVIKKIEDRKAKGKDFSIVVVAEGAKPIGGELSVARVVKGSFEPIRLGGAGEKLVREIEERTGIESRCTVLGYLQRGGSPSSYDRILSTRYGVAAAE